MTSFLRPGRFGDFWRAVRSADGETVAIKLLKPALFKDGEAIRRFQREARLLAEFAHPHVVQVLADGYSEAGDPFLVTECAGGRLLAEVIATGPMAVDRVRHVGAQIARVLAAAHARGIVHRGLSPDVILLVEQGDDPDWVKLQDFGLVHLEGVSGEPALTDIGQLLGDPTYMAPEYIGGQILDAHTDLYVLGVITFEMLTGKPPFVGRPIQILDGHERRDPPAPSSRVQAEIPDWMDDIVLRLLAKEPGDRYADAREVARALVSGS